MRAPLVVTDGSMKLKGVDEVLDSIGISASEVIVDAWFRMGKAKKVLNPGKRLFASSPKCSVGEGVLAYFQVMDYHYTTQIS